ncbi:hypothetical protein ACFSR6_03345 [Pedobacter vanadiisoli]|uniref:Helix-turn-helix domain-containing protein n=1 Tax=Pedobacter vanadiisoli TaxID=1761975 RepID=A0ABW5MGC6_9SPHI
MSEVRIQPYSKKELRALYGVSRTTLRVWISKIADLGDYIGGRYTPNQIAKIFNHIGKP